MAIIKNKRFYIGAQVTQKEKEAIEKKAVQEGFESISEYIKYKLLPEKYKSQIEWEKQTSASSTSA